MMNIPYNKVQSAKCKEKCLAACFFKDGAKQFLIAWLCIYKYIIHNDVFMVDYAEVFLCTTMLQIHISMPIN